MLSAVAAAALLLPAACGKEKDQKKAPLLVEDDEPGSAQAMGVLAVDFKCESVIAPEAVEAAVGRPLDPSESGFTPPQGVAKPCLYASAIPDQPEEWSWDIDCRERAMKDGARLMAEHGTKPGARAVMVGRSGLDHSNSQLIFFDDDAPCYVRVNGPGEAERLSLARAIADGLNRHNAPGKVSFVEVTTGEMKTGSGDGDGDDQPDAPDDSAGGDGEPTDSEAPDEK
jgi:hypothetical protein